MVSDLRSKVYEILPSTSFIHRLTQLHAPNDMLIVLDFEEPQIDAVSDLVWYLSII